MGLKKVESAQPMSAGPDAEAITSKDTIPPQRQDFAFAYILEVLTQGLYPNVFDVLREYVQNAFDAIDKHRKAYKRKNYKIKLNITDNSLFILDNGMGMDESEMQKYRYVGYSGKRANESAGFRGIGKLSGISVAEHLIVTSKTQGAKAAQLIKFNAKKMLEEILILKRQGKNKPLNDLIRDNTEFTTIEDDSDNHYTLVQLQNIRPEHSQLLDPLLVADYIAKICPVPFNEWFAYAAEIEKEILTNVPDYFFVPHYVNDQPVFKPYVTELDRPRFYYIVEEENEKPIAYGWACKHKEDSQLSDIGPRGLSFRIKNISIGDFQLVRKMLWHKNSHLAYWFFGEIHVIDEDVIPSSERSSFEDNAARQRLVMRTEKIMISQLIKQAQAASGRKNAEKKRLALRELVENTELDLEEGRIAKEMLVYRAAKIISASERLKKSLRQFKGKKKAEAKNLIDEAGDLVNDLNIGSDTKQEIQGAYDIKQEVALSREESRFYDIIIDCLKDVLTGDPDRFALVIDRLHGKMLEEYPRR